jgi:hypothetical protein
MGWVREDYVDCTSTRNFRLQQLFLPRRLLMEDSPFH